jgi:hypothetical protein
MNKKNDNESDFIDKLDWESYYKEGIACLKRRKPSDPYDTPTSYSIVAKGITAYLSYEMTPDYDSFRMLIQGKKLTELEGKIFSRYYNKCFSKFENRYKAVHPLPPEQKSKTDLIQDFLENEKQLFAESKPFYEETRYWEKDIIEEIKKAALYFPKWVKKTHLTFQKAMDTDKKNLNQETDTKKVLTLFDIWEHGRESNKKESYNKVIEFLKQQHVEIETSFVTETKGKLYWNENIRGNRQYLAAFIYTMTKKKWIAKWYKAPEYKRILENTFSDFSFNLEPFKRIDKFPPEEKYLKPFKNYPTNI